MVKIKGVYLLEEKLLQLETWFFFFKNNLPSYSPLLLFFHFIFQTSNSLSFSSSWTTFFLSLLASCVKKTYQSLDSFLSLFSPSSLLPLRTFQEAAKQVKVKQMVILFKLVQVFLSLFMTNLNVILKLELKTSQLRPPSLSTFTVSKKWFAFSIFLSLEDSETRIRFFYRYQ